MKRELTIIVSMFLAIVSFQIIAIAEELDEKEQYKIVAIKESAKQGDVTAQYNLAVMYDEGVDIPEDNEEANKWYMKAADQGHSVAQLNLGVNYYRGEGIEQSYEKAWNLLNNVRMNAPDRKAKWRARALLDRIKGELGVSGHFGEFSYPSWDKMEQKITEGGQK